ncbi:CapA family protein [Paenalkalicoccus suaedae]|uniref:CapA family protein n=1 Tax=Paenalkalicoccus suaedae TaxID=2592382 RepID=A0A859FBL7_9BACI|nr:CapA family protein [Paenalkalicoccus suaedae]QKS70101.1 CapA family protein [Paenalkalicoccus suaedae]
MNDKLDFKDRLKLMQVNHKKKALPHSLIALAILAVPFLGHNIFANSTVPTDTRPDDVTYRMSMVGDMMLGRHVADAARQANEPIDRVFNYVTPFFEESDYVTGNFETPIIDDSIPEIEAEIEDAELHNKDIHLYATPDAGDALINAGFDSVTLANNHMLDYGDLSLQQSLDYFRDADIDIIGMGDAMNLSEEEIAEGAIDAAGVKTFELDDDTRVGILGFTDVFVQGFSAQDFVGGVFTREYAGLGELRNRLIEAKLPEEEGGLGVDIMVVHIHWGDEYQIGSNAEQEERAQYLANYGVDIVIGHHSHVLEPVTILEGFEGNRMLSMNSLGNFVFDQGWTRTKESVIAQLDFLDNGSKELSFVPMFLNQSQPQETAGIMKPYRDFRIFRTLRKELPRELWEVRDGRLVIDLDAAGILEGVDVTP